MERVFGAPSGFLPERIVHLHPTTRCNLACQHCYSSSAPERRDELGVADILRVLPMLYDEGYAQLSISGGEPLMYRELQTVVHEARSMGFRVTMISNGLLVSARHDAVLAQLDGMAISFDGLEATHDEMRRHKGAFARALGTLQSVSSAGMPVAAAVSVTRHSLVELPDLVDLLAQQGARAIQVRPVARAGRAKSLASTVFSTESDRLRLFLVMRALQHELGDAAAGAPRLHCDVVPASALWHQRAQYDALLNANAHERTPLSSLVNPLVITDRGALRPLAFDMAPVFDIGSAHHWHADSSLQYQKHGMSRLQQLIADTLAPLQTSSDVVDWFDNCARQSHLC